VKIDDIFLYVVLNEYASAVFDFATSAKRCLRQFTQIDNYPYVHDIFVCEFFGGV
jgi:hypothetical protein